MPRFHMFCTTDTPAQRINIDLDSILAIAPLPIDGAMVSCRIIQAHGCLFEVRNSADEVKALISAPRAAPDLLDVLRVAVSFIETLHPIAITTSEQAVAYRLYVEANPHAAIAKAEGRP
jgi:hypothetical protein